MLSFFLNNDLIHWWKKVIKLRLQRKYLNYWRRLIKRKERIPKSWSHLVWRHQSDWTVAQSYLSLCYPMDYSMPDFPVHQQLPELTQTHVHWVGYAIQPSHPLSSPSLPAFNLSQNQGLFQWVSSLHQVAKYWSFSFSMNIQDWFPLGWTGWISLQSKGFSRVFSNTTVQKHQFFGAQLFSQSNSHLHHDYWKNRSFE